MKILIVALIVLAPFRSIADETLLIVGGGESDTGSTTLTPDEWDIPLQVPSEVVAVGDVLQGEPTEADDDWVCPHGTYSVRPYCTAGCPCDPNKTQEQEDEEGRRVSEEYTTIWHELKVGLGTPAPEAELQMDEIPEQR